MSSNQNNEIKDENLVAPDNHLIWSLLACILCCLPIGIMALLKSIKVNTLWAQGNYHQARIASDEALKYIKFSGLCAILVWILYFVISLIF